MSPAWGHLVGVLILLMMAAFIGIWIWVWLPHHKRTFDRLAILPMSDCSASPADAIQAIDEEEHR
ncbi:MAG: cbb3-type cytochrome c oxidase subunit 3 [Proteobacteria bacterium]|nr:cbb3-type cytochrome c oxidase subunit 3 [Pseudomonadota bacterium]